MQKMKGFAVLLFCTILFSTYMFSASLDTIRLHETIRDGETITSARGEFQLGFFSSGGSKNRYLGIWYKKISYGTVVWVANRDTPLTNSMGVVKVDGNKIILLASNESGTVVWSSNKSRSSVKNPTAQLLDTGNLVLRDEDDMAEENFIWQSFDYPVNTLLPGMKFGLDLVTGIDRYFTSWKSLDDPSAGSYTNRLDNTGYPQLLLWKGSVLWSRTGPWVGSQFSGSPNTNPNGIYSEIFVFNEKEIFYKFDLVNKNSSAIIRYILNPTGVSDILLWNAQNQNWMVLVTLQVTDCDRYRLCGANGICNINNSPRCECLSGFAPQFPNKWNTLDWSKGCVRRISLDCGTGEGFVKHSGLKLPDTRYAWYHMKINLEECKKLCLKNCSCTAYAKADIRKGGRGCFLWFNDLIDIRGYTEVGPDIYIRMAASELVFFLLSGCTEEARGTRLHRKVRIIVVSLILFVLLAVMSVFILKKKKLKRKERLKFSSESIALTKIESEELELPLISFDIIEKATNSFSHNNKLGEGGFGPVYKGILDNGQEIAVKRLSKNSGQGLEEFKNEVSCIAKLQHRNLVALLGCCVEHGERILIYEYMPHKSLDFFIFDEETAKSMDWAKRYNIIIGIARGLLYLHQDSKLRIIHRDLKAGNILLDHEMNPKISDFGLARSFEGSITEANTSRVVGTYGYMSPEYAIDGLFSVKSDVYSFGVLLIEIVSGMRNRLFSHPDHSLNLIGHAWIKYKENKLLELVDGVILESSNHHEVFRVIQIGLLCVQEDPVERPAMSQVVLMLSSKMKLPHPKQPGFFTERKIRAGDHICSSSTLSSSNDLTITADLPR
ncbi:G-type lectin S-receptor-like serine/threonine-protein kinase At4g27290 isoform X1 [Apium graveolens]|uniref:G-type lectin S-receptor-like serine/threonine-protein kinase At4g27290 isoform X1 n=1 Tax=Apium graveolens TaxID=4045 RepID=UPI003D7AE480